MDRGKRFKKIKTIQILGPCMVFLFGLWHFRDTYTGAAASGDMWLLKQYGILFAVILAFFGLASWMLLKKQCSMEVFFMVSSLVLGTLYLCVLPPLSAPDEVRHYISAYQLSNKLMGKEQADEDGYVYIRKEDDFIDNIYQIEGWNGRTTLGQQLDEETYALIHERGLFGVKEEGTMISCQLPVKTTPLAYLPQALGISAARVFCMSSIGLAFMGRFFNLLFFAAVGAWAIQMLPFGKELAVGVGLLPMTLHLAASFSYDGMIIVMCFTFASYCLYLAYRKNQVEWKDITILAAIIAWMGPCKMVYAVVLGFALLIPVKKFGGWKQWGIAAASVLAAFVISMVLVNSQVIASYAGGADNFVSWAGEEGYSLPYLLHNPVKYAEILYKTLILQGEFYFVSAFGGYLGNLDPVLNVPFFLILVFAGVLIVMSFLKPGEKAELSWIHKVWILVLFFMCAIGVMTAMLISWTPLSAEYIHGVQGRYFLPLLPFVLLTIKSRGLRLTANHDRKLLYFMCLGNGYVLLRLFSIVSMRL